MRMLIPLTVFLIIIPVACAENGRIFQLDYQPTQPRIIEDLKISVGIENNGKTAQSYVLLIDMIKEGRLVYEEEFSFKLEVGKIIFISPVFKPEELGEFQIIAKLYDEYKINLIDSRIKSFDVTTEIGPFDISVDLLTHRVTPSQDLPALLSLKNMGTNGTDVDVRIEIPCEDQKIYKTMTIYIPSLSSIDKEISIPVCKKEGSYQLIGSVVMFNKSLATSITQFFVIETFIDLSFDVPESIKMSLGESKTFDVAVTNLGTERISDLKFVIEKIPLSWQKISPSSIAEVKPGEKVIFLVNITVPKDAEPQTYKINMLSAAKETLMRKGSQLEVVPIGMVTIPEKPIITTSRLVFFGISIFLIALVVYLLKRGVSETEKWGKLKEKWRKPALSVK